ncbi:MAG: 50S ribosomal protein L3 [Candidatus Dojkabacteria bacterium]|nr:MAG: 50S ribosomal protein L3 [Candidatus Dojkabacteria bacterium]
MKYILGIKKGMTRVFDGDHSVAVTVVDVDGCKVSFADDKGYELGIGSKKGNGAAVGKYKKYGSVPRYTQWVSTKLDDGMEVGSDVSTDGFEKGVKVNVKATTKGKGFAGVVKRWGFHGGPKTHGQSDRHRAPGSIGAGTDPGRVLKGKRMAGRMGGDQITVKNKMIVDKKENYLLVSGAIPGSKGSKVLIAVAE